MTSISAFSAEFAVNTQADYIDKNVGDGICEAEIQGIYKCTLRAAMQEANALPGFDRILVPAGTYLVTQGGPIDDTAAQGDLDILDDVEIVGADKATTVIDGNNIDRVFHLPPAGSQLVQATISAVTIRRGYAAAADGGGIFNAEFLTLNDVIVTSNIASLRGGGISNTGTLVVNGATVDANLANGGGGLAALAGDVFVMASSIANNQATASGGGLHHGSGSVQISQTTFSGNSVASNAGVGGAIYSGASLHAYDVLVASNTSNGDGGGVRVDTNSNVRISNGLIAGNTARVNGGGVSVNGLFVATNVTVSGNSAASGGGIHQQTTKTDATNLTVAFNAATSGGNLVKALGIFNIQNSIISNAANGGNCAGVIDSLGYNIDSDGSCNLKAVGDTSTVDPLVLGLAGNGGFTQSHAVADNSPAINTGSNTVCPGIDQRGYRRNDGLCDVGAYETGTTPSKAGIVQFEKAIYSVAEGTTFLTVNVVRVNGAEGTVSVNYLTRSGTAKAAVDYAHTTGTLVWTDGDASTKVISIPVMDDAAKEPTDETALVLLTFPTGGATLGTTTATTFSITDNDWTPGAISFATTGYVVTENAGNAQITVTRTDGKDGEVTVAYTTSDGTAVAGKDYAVASGTLTIPSGAASATFSIGVIDNSFYESAKTLHLELSNPTAGAVLGSPVAATLTILNDDPKQAGQLRFTSTSTTISEAAGSVIISVERVNGTDGTISADYAYTLFNTPAASSMDFKGAAGTLEFAHGETTKTFVVSIIDDSIFEGDESFTLVLNNLKGGATLTDPSQLSIAIVDNENPNPGKIRFAKAQYSVAETDGFIDIPVQRFEGADSAVAVSYAVTTGTATANADFSGGTGTLRFGHNEAEKHIRLSILADNTAESDETIVVVLSGPTDGAALGNVTTTTITIRGTAVESSNTTPPGASPAAETPGGDNAPENPAPPKDSPSDSVQVGGGMAGGLELLILTLVAAIHRRSRTGARTRS